MSWRCSAARWMPAECCSPRTTRQLRPSVRTRRASRSGSTCRGRRGSSWRHTWTSPASTPPPGGSASPSRRPWSPATGTTSARRRASCGSRSCSSRGATPRASSRRSGGRCSRQTTPTRWCASGTARKSTCRRCPRSSPGATTRCGPSAPTAIPTAARWRHSRDASCGSGRRDSAPRARRRRGGTRDWQRVAMHCWTRSASTASRRWR